MKKLAVYATLGVLAHALIVMLASVRAGEDRTQTHWSTGFGGRSRDQ